ncbi:MAG: 1-acyl-sn-glycerol-3-phosphate acyltransferase [Gammaproteobacteria bacterium]|nr:1-acyl-sn-glycerol-3-phosphate acyltransferase [Gammaproteobacteria bacterium]
MERLSDSLAAGHGIMLTPNHCRPSDPVIVGELCRRVGTAPLFIASWHIFLESSWKAFLLRRAGAFSVYREGMDRRALQTAIDIVYQAKRPLVIFPEGVVTRTNDRLAALMEGSSFIGRAAGKRRKDTDPPGQVVIHPVAIRYFFQGDIEKTLQPVLNDIEKRLSWQPKQDLDLYQRIYLLGDALLCLKEMEYLKRAHTGPIHERLERLIDRVLMPLEQEWLDGNRGGNVVARVKMLRTAILPDMIHGQISDSERERRWRQLADMYIVQQMSHYPPDYIKSNPTSERMLETVERFEEDLTDVCRTHAPMTATVQVGEAIPISPNRDRSATEDPIMSAIEASLLSMLAEMASPGK